MRTQSLTGRFSVWLHVFAPQSVCLFFFGSGTAFNMCRPFRSPVVLPHLIPVVETTGYLPLPRWGITPDAPWNFALTRKTGLDAIPGTEKI